MSADLASLSEEASAKAQSVPARGHSAALKVAQGYADLGDLFEVRRTRLAQGRIGLKPLSAEHLRQQQAMWDDELSRGMRAIREESLSLEPADQQERALLLRVEASVWDVVVAATRHPEEPSLVRQRTHRMENQNWERMRRLPLLPAVWQALARMAAEVRGHIERFVSELERRGQPAKGNPSEPIPQNWLSPRAVGKIIDRHHSTVIDLVKRGLVRGARDARGRWRVDPVSAIAHKKLASDAERSNLQSESQLEWRKAEVDRRDRRRSESPGH